MTVRATTWSLGESMGVAAKPPLYRYERKFAVERCFRWQAEDALLRNTAHFSPLFSPRWVNNIYLDTPEWSSFQENRDSDGGLRAKVRIRWYGDFEGSVERPVLEVKIRNGYVNRKRSYPLSAMAVDSRLCWDHLLEVFEASGLPTAIRQELKRLQPALGNRYWRSYFLSADGHFRATVDSELAYLPLQVKRNRLVAWSRDCDTVIIELKYALEFDREARGIACQLPFRLTRSSKYATGVARVAG